MTEMIIPISDKRAWSTMERCLGPVRWSASSGKLQQLWEVKGHRSGTHFNRREEWRDVPTVDLPAGERGEVVS